MATEENVLRLENVAPGSFSKNSAELPDIGFAQAIELVAQFTRPIHIISRNYQSKIIERGAATLFFVNPDGWALTCWHVAEQIIAAKQIGERRNQYLSELKQSYGQKKIRKLTQELAKKHGFSKNSAYELCHRFVDCIDGNLDINILRHPKCDVALLHFRGFTKLHPQSFPVFADDGAQLLPGKFLCRLGFPFAEFTNYQYNEHTDSIGWTELGRQDTPRFPIDGMVTRHLVENQTMWGFEVSTPGLRGQSGGPAFDTQGRIWGMQSRTASLDLNIDVNIEVLRNSKKKRINESAFLHLGHCIHVDILKSFMREHKVSFDEG